MNKVWKQVEIVPRLATSVIEGGRLRGMTSINPVWKIKTMTEIFGQCGVGWKYSIEDERYHAVGDEEFYTVKISLQYQVEDKWSEPLYGVGTSKIRGKEKNGFFNDTNYAKKAITSALSTPFKLLGFGANIYFQEGDKEDQPDDENSTVVANREESDDRDERDKLIKQIERMLENLTPPQQHQVAKAVASHEAESWKDLNITMLTNMRNWIYANF